MDSSVKDFEPKEALIGGEDGLLFYRRIASFLKHNMGNVSKVFLEIGHNIGDEVIDIFDSSVWCSRKIIKDLAKLDRFVILKK